MSKVRKAELSFLYMMSSGPVLHFCQVPSKYSEGNSSYRAGKKSISNKTREITPKVRKPELSFFYATCRLVLFYISRVRVTDRHCRHLLRKIKFGTKNHKLAKASGEKNIA